MAKKYRNLIGRIVSDSNMRLAFARTACAKRLTTGYLEFKEYSEVNLKELADDIAAGTYRIGPYREFMVYEPKPRLISALTFRDRVAQHALVSVIGPIFEATLLPRTFACRTGMGTHAGVKAVQAEMRRNADLKYYLKTDFSKYFHSIDRSVLRGLIERKISCRATLAMIDAITPKAGVGLPIGNLTSQLWANVYGGLLDRHLQIDLGVKNWFRYMDDVVVLGDDLACLRSLKEEVERFSRDVMHLRLSKWNIGKVASGVNFLGYRICPTHKLLRRQSVIRAKRKIARFNAARDYESLQRFLASWLGHAGWADAHHLLKSLRLEEDYDHQYPCRP